MFKPETTVRFRQTAGAAGGFGNDPSGSGENPPVGVAIPFYLKNAASGPVTLKILREQNGTAEPVRTFALNTRSPGPGNVQDAEAAAVAAARAEQPPRSKAPIPSPGISATPAPTSFPTPYFKATPPDRSRLPEPIASS